MTGSTGSVKMIFWYLLVLCIGVVIITLLCVNALAQYIVFTLPLIIYPVYKLIDMHRKILRKITFLFNAVASNDYNFNIADSTVLNYSMNNIRDILAGNHKRELEKERYYELIEQNVSTGILSLYPDGAVYKVNREALKLLGVEYLAHINYLKGIDAELADVLVNIKKGENKRFSVRNEGGELCLLINASEFKLEDVVLKVITINDINNALDEKELEAWVKLTRILTHEIMNSLAPIVSLSDTLIETNKGLEVSLVESDKPLVVDSGELEARKELTDGLEIIKDTSKGLVLFVEQYRKFTRLQTPVKEPFEIKPLLERNLRLLCGAGGAAVSGGMQRSVKWLLKVEPEDILVYADADLVSLAVVNIIKNAVSVLNEAEQSVGLQEKFEGRVEVNVYLDEKENVVIDISNNGGAIGKEIAEDIFLPFFTTKENGSGIGLSVAKQIMYRHGGQLRLVNNTEENVTFRLIFP